MKKRVCLAIAGFDGSGGAGILADTKTFIEHDLYPLGVITSVTAQNTTGVKDKLDIDKNFLDKQLGVLFENMHFNSIKIGMIPNRKHIKVISKYIKKYNVLSVLDPVMISSSGFRLLSKKGIKYLKKELLSNVDLITPNIKEAEILTDCKINSVKDMKKAALKLKKTGAKSILIKGGHLPGKKAIDILYHKGKFYFFKDKKIKNRYNFHGTGCILSSAITANLANGHNMQKSIKKAKKFITKKIKNSFMISSEGAKYII